MYPAGAKYTLEDKKSPQPPAVFSTAPKDDDPPDDDEMALPALLFDSAKIYKNLLLISSAFLFVFTAFQALSNLQSSINCDEGLGLASLSTIYATLILSGESNSRSRRCSIFSHDLLHDFFFVISFES